MKCFFQSMLLAALFCLAGGYDGYAQNSWPLRVDVLTAAENGDLTQPMLGVQLQPGEGFASRFALHAGLRGGAETFADGLFDVQQKSWAAMGELRYYPFGPQRIAVQKKSDGRKKRRANGCAQFCYSNDRPPAFHHYLRGFYLAPGYRYEATDFTYLARPELEAPIESFPYRVVVPGPTFRVGYHLRLAFLSVGASYGWQFSRPRWEGPVDIFGESLYTSTFPFRYRLDSALRVEVGVGF